MFCNVAPQLLCQWFSEHKVFCRLWHLSVVALLANAVHVYTMTLHIFLYMFIIVKMCGPGTLRIPKDPAFCRKNGTRFARAAQWVVQVARPAALASFISWLARHV